MKVSSLFRAWPGSSPPGVRRRGSLILTQFEDRTVPATGIDVYLYDGSGTFSVSADDGVLRNDSGAAAVTSYTQPTEGSVAVAPDGGFVYEADPGPTADTVTFSYQTTDDTGRQETGTVVLTGDQNYQAY